MAKSEERMSIEEYNAQHAIAAYNLRAEERGVLENHHAWLNEDGSITVVSDSDPKVKYRVTYAGIPHLIHFKCSCPSGEHRTGHLVPCKHATRAARRLEREGLAKWEHGHWVTTLEPEDGADEAAVDEIFRKFNQD